MRLSRFLCLSAVLFAICFWWAGGDVIKEKAADRLHTSVEGAFAPSAEGSAGPRTAASAAGRVYRIFALKSAVDKEIQTKTYTRLAFISPTVQQAMIAVEDNRFYTHLGFDVTAMLRASLVNLQYGHIEEGASTITQQLVKNLFLSQDQSLSRKAEELILAIDMELRYSKEEILELYLNTIYFGSGFYGIAEASMGYFAKMPGELSLAEASMLAGLPNAPSLYSPYVDLNAAKKRQAIVLESMVKNGFISPSTAEETKRENLVFAR